MMTGTKLGPLRFGKPEEVFLHADAALTMARSSPRAFRAVPGSFLMILETVSLKSFDGWRRSGGVSW